jgi:hypothetical protein
MNPQGSNVPADPSGQQPAATGSGVLSDTGSSFTVSPSAPVSAQSSMPSFGQPPVPAPMPPTLSRAGLSNFLTHRSVMIFIISLGVLAVLGLVAFITSAVINRGAHQTNNLTLEQKVNNLGISTFKPADLPLAATPQGSDGQQLKVNGQLEVSTGLVLTPGGAPTTPRAGQIYYDQTTNQPYFYNGTSFISVGSTFITNNVTNPTTNLIQQAGSTTIIQQVSGGSSLPAPLANSVLLANGSNIESFGQTLPATVQGNIVSTGILTSGSIANGFGTISTGNNIATTAALHGGTGLIKPGSDSASVFQVQNAASSNLFTLDTSNSTIIMGNDGTPTALTMRGGAAVGTNAPGANITFDAANGTGAGGSGDLIFRTGSGASSRITLDNATTATDNGFTTFVTWNHTTANQNNRILIVGIETHDWDNPVTGVTYNGVALTQIGSELCGGTHCKSEMWYLINPAFGTHQVAVTLNSAFGTGHGAAFGAATYYNVNQATPLGTPVADNNKTNSSSVSVATTSASQLVVDAFAANETDWTPDSSQTQVWSVNANDGAVGTTNLSASSYKTGSASGTTMIWDLAGTPPDNAWADIAVPLNPVLGITPDPLNDRLHITSDGNIGINNAAPVATLDVTGSGNFTAGSTTALRVQNASNANVLVVDAKNNNIVLGNDGTTSAITLRGGVASGINTSGSNVFIDASNGTGTGGSGDLILRTASPDIAAITDDGNDSIGTSPTTTLTFSHTTTIQNSRVLIVGINIKNSDNPARAVTSVTYAGFPLTKIDSQDCTTGGVTCHAELWYLVNPATGANNVVITTTAATIQQIDAGASTYYNVDQTTPIGASAKASGLTQPSAISVASNASQLIVDTIGGDSFCNFGPSSGQTETWFQDSSRASYKPGAAGTTAMGWGTCGENWAAVGVALNPPASPAPNTFSDRLHITAAGNIGIGTANPDAAITGFALASSQGMVINPQNNKVATLSLSSTGSAGSILGLGVNNSNHGAIEYGIQAADQMDIFTNNLDRITVQGGGNVGIGTTAPSQLLDVNGNIVASSPTGTLYLAGIDTYIGNDGAGNMNLHVNDSSINLSSEGGSFSSISFSTNTSGSPTLRMLITNNGNVGIGGDNNPQNTLKVLGSLCVKNAAGACAGSTSGTIYATNTTVQAADLAENYVSSQILEPGDVIMPAGDGDNQAIVKTTDVSSLSIGVVSTNPGVTLNSDAQTNAAHPHLYPIALSGRVPVKVSTQNGPIHTGDYLAVSSTPGVAVRAVKPGLVIGQALEDYANTSATGAIMTFVRTTWADPTGSGDFTVQNAQGTTLLSTDTTNMTVTVVSLKVTGILMVNGHIVTGGSAPTVSVNTGLCTSGIATANITGNDTSGTITVTLPKGCSGSDVRLATITFASPFTATPKVILSPNNLATAHLLGFTSNPAANGFEITTGQPLNDDVSYSWNYFVTQ